MYILYGIVKSYSAVRVNIGGLSAESFLSELPECYMNANIISKSLNPLLSFMYYSHFRRRYKIAHDKD